MLGVRDGMAVARGRRLGAIVAAATLLAVAGCTTTTPASEVAADAVKEKQFPAAQIAMAPVDAKQVPAGTAKVRVTATDGTLTAVTLIDRKDRHVRGAVSADGTTWRPTGRLRPGATYRLDAVAVDANGLKTTKTSTFSTAKPKAILETSISPVSGSTVGVGMPIVVRFSEPVKNRAAVEQALLVKASKRITGGAWSWMSDEEVHFRPRTFWPAYTDVSLDVRLRGVSAGKGVWGAKNRKVDFSIGSSMITKVNVQRHTATIYRNGKVARTVPVSTGKDGFLTRGGTKVILEKHTLKIMDAATIGIAKNDPEYYRLEVPYAMRITWSGEFVHAAPWSVASQGRDNVSHGCIGMSTSNAIWLFNQTHIGDVVKVVGSSRQLEPGNGYTDWNTSWKDWTQGSAL